MDASSAAADAILSIQTTALTRASLGPLRTRLSSDTATRVSIDVASVTRVTADGLVELIELLTQLGSREARLLGVHGELLRASIETQLAELVELWLLPLAAPLAPRRWAIIKEEEQLGGVGSLDVAGQPLVIRQLQWLRARGIEDVVVQILAGSDAIARAELLLGTHPLVSRVRVVPSALPLSAPELALRAGLPHDAWYLDLDASALPLGDCELPKEAGVARALRLRCAAERHVRPVELHWRSHETIAAETSDLALEGTRIECIEHAHAISCRILAGHYPSVQVHASDARGDGIWIARGVTVSALAKLTGPLYLGPDAIVLDYAEVGPNALIGAGSVIERAAQVSDACVAGNTLLGEGVKLKHALAEPRGITDFADEKHTSIVDALVLARHREPSTALGPRCLAALLLALLLVPWLCAGLYTRLRGRAVMRTIVRRDEQLFRVGAIGVGPLDLVPALFDVVLGARDLVGVANPSALEFIARQRDLLAELRGGAIDLGGALAPSGNRDALLRMWRWYARHKSRPLDRELLKAARISPRTGAQVENF